ncbi:T-complex protein 11-like protein 1 isoform X2 [Littorina saxatilis]
MGDNKESGPEGLNNSIDGEMAVDDEKNGSQSETESKKRRTRTPSPNPTPMQDLMVAASPPKFISFEQLMDAANGVKNMSLAHEIAVNSEFQIEKLQPEKNSIEKQVKEVMQKAFWDALEAKLSQDPPDYSHALVLIEEVKENLLSLLLPQHVRLRAQVLEVLDMDLIRQKIHNEAFDIFFYASYVMGTMARLCAPVRDERVAALKELKDVVPLFKEIFEVLDLMKMDMANFTIQQMRPYLQQQSVDYERKKFNEFLKTQEENGTDGLEFTRLWLKRNFQKLLAAEKEAAEQGQTTSSTPNGTGNDSAATSPPPLPSSSSSSPPSSKATPANILNEGYMETLNWDPNNIYPESLVLDQSRFCEIEKKCKLLTTIAAVQLVTYSSVGAPIAGISSLKTTLKSHVQTLLEGESV